MKIPDCSQLVRGTSDNLDLQLASEVGASCGTEFSAHGT